jgi:hypothetical protein
MSNTVALYSASFQPSVSPAWAKALFASEGKCGSSSFEAKVMYKNSDHT